MDSIKITNLRAFGYTGALPEEKVLGQWFSVDLTLFIDISTPGRTDDLTTTVNYAAPVAAVKSLIEASRFDLVERLATAIADTVLAMAPIDAIRVQLTKETPPIPGFGGTVGIDIIRQSPSAAGGVRPANETEGKP